jgi:DNA polymerase-3 subunit gamma/tau
MRDAQSLLDQLLAFGAGRLTVAQVHALLGTATDDRVLDLADAILARDVPRALGLLHASADEGLQLGELLDQLVEHWRGLMLLAAGGPLDALAAAEATGERLKSQSAALGLDLALAGLDVLSTTKARLRGSGYALTLLEMAVVRLCRLEDLVAVANLAQTISQSGVPVVPTGTNVPRSLAQTSGQSNAGEVSPQPAVPDPGKKKPERNGEVTARLPTTASPGAVEPDPSALVPLTVDTLPAVWRGVLGEVGPMLAGQLEKAGLPAILGPRSLALRFPSRYAPDYDFCREPTSVQRVEAALRRAAGQDWTLRVELDPTAPSEGGEATPPRTPPASLRERQREALELPVLKRAVDLFGATLMSMDPEFGVGRQADPTE